MNLTSLSSKTCIFSSVTSCAAASFVMYSSSVWRRRRSLRASATAMRMARRSVWLSAVLSRSDLSACLAPTTHSHVP